MKRRGFIKYSTAIMAGSAVLPVTGLGLAGNEKFILPAGPGAGDKKHVKSPAGMGPDRKTHIISLSFDDGFARSFMKTAEIYEKYDLKACFNVIASGGEKTFQKVGEYIKPGTLGNFDLWNELQSRGHEVMPHGYKHANLTEIPLGEAKDLVNRCLDIFGEQLEGFDKDGAVFNFPFNASNRKIEKWLGKKVMAFRTSGSAVNPLPSVGDSKLTCISYGPENIDDYLEEQIDQFLGSQGGWFIFNTHGLDDEGWGPMSSSYLDELLDRLTGLEQVALLPVGEAFKSNL